MKFIPLILFVFLISSSPQNYSPWNKIVLDKGSTEFLEMYDNLKEIDEIQTDGYYYCFDSIISYKLDKYEKNWRKDTVAM